MKPVLVLGARGQVGRALCREQGEDAIGLGRDKADLSNPSALPDILSAYAPGAVINAAAYTQVDKAEQEETLAYTINAEAPAVMAEWCRIHNIPFVHYSTDYVFDGAGHTAWREEDQTNPLNIYGKSKREGERKIEQAGGKYLILRTSLVYDAHGENFFNLMLKLGAKEEEIKVVKDQCSAPTYAPHLAHATVTALRRATILDHFPSGIYHLSNSGYATRYEFAQAIFKAAEESGMHLRVEKVTPVASSHYPRPAQRPAFSALDCSKAKTILGVHLPEWHVGVTDCIQEKHAHH